VETVRESQKFDLQTIISDPPKLHEENGQLISDWRIDNTTCFQLNGRLKPGLRTLETGAGLSTIIFAANGCQHTCITPSEAQVDRIQDYCRSANIDTSIVEFIVAKSSDVIHQLPRSEFDLILIDGCHGFPSIFVDFYYAAKLLKIGGTLIIDDMHIYTCQLAARFAQSDPGWNVEKKTTRVAFATKVSDTIDKEWSHQQFVVRRSSVSKLARTWTSFRNSSHTFRSRFGLTRTQWRPLNR
jgi:cyclopropane fatty-acyl-phospholipid synthase-like methyltransferase